MKKFRFLALLGLLLTGCHWTGGAGSTAHLPSVTNFDAASYCGVWYEIARLPQSFEHDLDAVTAQYTLQKDGTIAVFNRGVRDGRMVEARGTARLKKGMEGRGELEVSFQWPFYGAYRVLYLAPYGKAALVAGASMDDFWILSRTPELPDEELYAYLGMASNWGFDVKRLEYPDPVALE